MVIVMLWPWLYIVMLWPFCIRNSKTDQKDHEGTLHSIAVNTSHFLARCGHRLRKADAVKPISSEAMYMVTPGQHLSASKPVRHRDVKRCNVQSTLGPPCLLLKLQRCCQRSMSKMSLAAKPAFLCSASGFPNFLPNQMSGLTVP